MRAALLVLAATVALIGTASSASPPMPTVTLILKGHRFTPAEVKAPAGQRFKIVVVNQDTATDEFDSHDLKVEQLITPNGRVSITVGPLKPGVYNFMGEFHSETAQGKLTAVEAEG